MHTVCSVLCSLSRDTFSADVLGGLSALERTMLFCVTSDLSGVCQTLFCTFLPTLRLKNYIGLDLLNLMCYSVP